MQVIPVLDVRQGNAVRAFAGQRAHYDPLRSILHDSTNPITLAGATCDTLGLKNLYIADLDAILGDSPPDVGLYRELNTLGLTLWVDAGVRDLGDVPRLIEAGVERIVVGLETVRGPEALAEIVAEAGADRVVFSLDLYQGRPMVDARATWGTDRAVRIASRAIGVGITRLIHLDLARVGTGRGVEVLDLRGLTSRPELEWTVGGGISGVEEIEALERLGVRGVLVGSAFHDGRITRRDLERLS